MIPLLIVLAALLLLNCLPLGAHVIYNENGLVLKAVLGLIQIRLLPKKPGKRKKPAPPSSEIPDPSAQPTKAERKALQRAEKKAARKQQKKEKKAEKKLKKRVKPKVKKPLGALLEEFLPLVRLAGEAIGELPRLPVIRKLKLRITYGGEDAAKAAMNYGAAWGAIGAAMAVLTRKLRIRKQDVRPELDYDCGGVRVSADVCFTLTLGRLVVYLVHYGAKALGILTQTKKSAMMKEKAVQQNESSSS